jgi:hypothetical protein
MSQSLCNKIWKEVALCLTGEVSKKLLYPFLPYVSEMTLAIFSFRIGQI